jgi:hypothetical protein
MGLAGEADFCGDVTQRHRRRTTDELTGSMDATMHDVDVGRQSSFGFKSSAHLGSAHADLECQFGEQQLSRQIC